METVGSLIDKLSIVNLKLWHQEEVAQDPEADDQIVAAAKRRISVLNLQRNALIQEVDELLLAIVSGQRAVPVFPQMKDYTRRK